MNRLIQIILLCVFASGLRGAVIVTFTPSPQAVTAMSMISVNAAISGLGAGSPPSVGSFDIFLGYDASLLTPTGVVFGNLLGIPDVEALTDVRFFTGIVEFTEVSLLANANLDALQPSGFTLATVNFNALRNGSAAFQYLGGPVDDANGNLIFGTKTIPEPATFMISALGLVLVASGHRYRSRSGARNAKNPGIRVPGLARR